MVSLASGVTALALLVGLQGPVASASSRSHRIERLVEAEPALLSAEATRPAAANVLAHLPRPAAAFELVFYATIRATPR